MQASEIFILSAQRTAIGTFGGALRDVPLADLATTALKAALLTSKVDPERIGHVVMGNVIPTEPQDAYLARVAAINAAIWVKLWRSCLNFGISKESFGQGTT